MIRIPNSEGKFSQPNRGDIYGNLNRSLNLDLKTSPGKLKTSARLTVNTKDNDGGISNMGLPIGFAFYQGRYWAACGIGAFGVAGSGKMFRTGDSSAITAFVNDSTGSSPTVVSAALSDMIVWNPGNYSAGDVVPLLLVSTSSGSGNSQIQALRTSSWLTSWFTSTVSGSFVTQGGLKNLCQGFNGNLYITDDDQICYVPVGTTAMQVAVQPNGPPNTTNGTVDFNGRYRPIWIRSTSTRLWIGLMTFDADFGTKGYVAEWDTVGTAVNKIYDLNAPCALSCTIVDDVPYIIDAYGVLRVFGGTGFQEVARLPVANLNIEMPGIYDDLTNSRWIHQRGMDVVDGKININVNNFVSTGVYIEDMPSGTWEYDPKNPSQGLYHKSSPCAASTDWGQQQILTAGAIMESKRATNSLLAGYAYYTDNVTTSRNGIFYDDIVTNSNKRSSFVIPFINSPNIEDNWISSTYRFRPLVASEKIIGKWRKAKKANLPFLAAVTWTSTTTFTSTEANFQYASVGDEVEITMGVGASGTAHITVLPAPSAGTYTVTIDTAIGGASGTGKVKVNNFRKFITITTQGVSEQGAGLPDGVGTRVQLKTEIQAQGDFELDDVTIINSKNR